MKLSAIIRQRLACFHATVISWFNHCYCCVHCRVESCQYKGMYVRNRNAACFTLKFITIRWKSDRSLS